MLSTPLPSSFAHAKHTAISHVATRNEVEARTVRYAALEMEALMGRDRLNKKYDHVSPRVLPKIPTPTSQRYRTASPESHMTQEPEKELSARLIMPQKQMVGQIVCPGGESRRVNKDTEQSVLGAWDKLNVSKRVLESHDVFLLTAGRVKPYLTITESMSPRRQAKHSRHQDQQTLDSTTSPIRGDREEGETSELSSSRSRKQEIISPRVPVPPTSVAPSGLRREDLQPVKSLAAAHNPWLKGVRKGLSHLKDSTVVDFQMTAVSSSPRGFATKHVNQLPLGVDHNQEQGPTLEEAEIVMRNEAMKDEDVSGVQEDNAVTNASDQDVSYLHEGDQSSHKEADEQPSWSNNEQHSQPEDNNTEISQAPEARLRDESPSQIVETSTASAPAHDDEQEGHQHQRSSRLNNEDEHEEAESSKETSDAAAAGVVLDHSTAE